MKRCCREQIQWLCMVSRYKCAVEKKRRGAVESRSKGDVKFDIDAVLILF